MEDARKTRTKWYRWYDATIGGLGMETMQRGKIVVGVRGMRSMWDGGQVVIDE
jgi:hypothetical protein